KTLSSNWEHIANSGSVLGITVMPDGTIVGIGMNNQLYTRKTLTSNWEHIANSGSVLGITVMPDGTIVGIGMNNQLYTRKTLTSNWEHIANSGSVIGITVMSDGTIVGIGMNNQLYTRKTLTSNWEHIANSGSVLGIVCYSGVVSAPKSQTEVITEVKADTTAVLKSLGRIVVNADEWTISDAGIKTTPDAATFALNIAKYFVGENKGKFHVLSNNFGLTGASLEQTMTKAGHTWTKGMNIPINLETLQKYDGIFIGGDLVNNQVLIEYVKNGGKVYLCAGTGQGGAQAEANNWNTFLAAFGLKFQGVYNGIDGNIAVNNPNHPLFAGVKTLYQNNGNSITDLQTDSQLNQIVLTHSSGQGLIGTAEFIKPPAHPNIATGTKIQLKSWKGDYLHRPDSAQGVTSWNTGIGNEWVVEFIGENKIQLKSWKGDYLHRPDSAQGVTSWNTGIGNEWVIEFIGENKIQLKSWKGDYLHRPDSAQGVTSWNTGIGNEWVVEIISTSDKTIPGVIGIGTNNQLYTRKTLTSNWEHIPNSGSVIGITVMSDGTIVGIGTNNQLYTRKTLSSNWEHIANSGSVLGITVMPDGTIVGIGMNNQLYTRKTLTSNWEHIANSGS
ncbi:hypothetical protein IQ227_25975, partial [Anabaena aphanizomenioides LEGE 00250]